MTPLPWFDADQISALLPVADAVDVLERTLAEGFDPASDPARSLVPVRRGQLLLMPAEAGAEVGVKLVSVAPGNPSAGRPRIQAIYLLLDAETLTPQALLDGVALTSLRTPAMSAMAARHLAAPDARKLVVFGAGPQAEGHVAAIRAVRPIEEVVVVGRDQQRAAALAARVGGIAGRPGDVAGADIVACATTAVEALFAGHVVRPNACVIAVGSHEPYARELDGALMRRSHVVVEDRATALREAGDVIRAGLAAEDLIPIADLVTGLRNLEPGPPRVFKGVGMAWQDLAVAAEIVHRRSDGSG